MTNPNMLDRSNSQFPDDNDQQPPRDSEPNGDGAGTDRDPLEHGHEVRPEAVSPQPLQPPEPLDSASMDSDEPPPKIAELLVETLKSELDSQQPPVEVKEDRGPGILEALLITVSIVVVQLVLGIGFMAVGTVFQMLRGNLDLAQLRADGIPPGIMQLSIVGQMLGFMLLAIGYAWFRARSAPRRLLGIRRFPASHLAIVVLLVLPTSMVSSEIYRIVEEQIWQPAKQAAPTLNSVDELNTVEAIASLSETMPLPLMLLAFALAPAVAEEIIFRGLVGWGMISRFGLLAGVLVTSVTFAVFHMHPVHAAGVFLLGLVMHLLYVTTRSLLAPMLYHFLNNGMASVLTKLSPEEAMSTEPISPIIAILSLATVAGLMYLLWETRVEFIDPADGRKWEPETRTLAEPPPEQEYTATRHRASLDTLVPVAILCAACYAALLLDIPGL